MHARRRLAACARLIGHEARSRPTGTPFIGTSVNFRTFLYIGAVRKCADTQLWTEPALSEIG